MLHKRYFYFSSQTSTKMSNISEYQIKTLKKLLENNEKEGIESAFYCYRTEFIRIFAGESKNRQLFLNCKMN